MKNFLSRLCLYSLVMTAGGQQAFGELLVDSGFDGSADSADLRADSAGQDWYESRDHTPERLTLNTADIGGNTGKKAALTNFGVGGIAYLTQEFSSPQSARFVVSCDIYIDRIENNGNYDRSGLIYIGDDSISSNAPTGTSNERFVLLGFYDSTPGDTGDDLEIRVRTSSSQSWSTTSTWTSVATGLSYDTWYTVKLVIDVAGTFDLYVNDELRSAGIPKYSGYSSSSIQLITFAAGSNGRGDFYVDNVSAQSTTTDPASTWTELTSDDFESGWGSYRDGGSDCRRSSRDAAFAHQGTYCARIRDNSGTSSSFYSTSGVDVATPGYTEIKVEFWYYPRSMESGENFWVQYYDGSSWQTVANYVSGTDFSNGSFHHVVDLIIQEGAPYDFPTDMKIRFMCDASGNRDYIYVDEVVVSAQ